jgi:lipopolysaccharide transport system ATP-binding protein
MPFLLITDTNAIHRDSETSGSFVRMKPAIRVENLSKQYRLGVLHTRGYRTLRESLVDAARAPWWRLRALTCRDKSRVAGADGAADCFWALKDISFDVEPGEVIGLIGRNGAGKSTLLKILSRITEPTEGRARIRGRVGSLLEVGTGFHPELTGRENIYLNGAILGMRRHEITRKFDDIVAFAEMETFLDTPVKRYSSGMYVRLAFAVAAHLDLEIMVVDEVLAVGDVDFQKKCLQQMGNLAQGGRTVLFVSHNLGIVHRLCPRTILLRQGRIEKMGPTAEMIRSYLNESLTHDGLWERPESLPPTKDVCLRQARILSNHGSVTGIVNSEDPFSIEIESEVMRPVPNYEIGIQLRNSQGITITTCLDSDTATWPERTRRVGRYRSTCRFPAHLLAPGTYFLSFAAHIINQQTFDTVHDGLGFEIAEAGCIRFKRNDRRDGVVMPILDWDIAQMS